MNLNSDFDQRVVQSARDAVWTPSPLPGVERRMLDRIGIEVARGGCTLFVKLWQFAADDLAPVRIDTSKASWHPGLVPGLSVMPLHEHEGVSTALVRWAPQTRFNTHTHPGGEEILVLEGVFRDELGEYAAGTWLRSPRGSRHTPYTGAEGALIYVKVGAIGADFMPLSAARRQAQ